MSLDHALKSFNETMDDVHSHLLSTDVVSAKEVLWRMAIVNLLANHNITDDRSFVEVEEFMRSNSKDIEHITGMSATLQDALVEFRKEYRDMLK